MTWACEAVTHGLEARVSSKLPLRQALASLKIRFRDIAIADPANQASRFDLAHSRRVERGTRRHRRRCERLGGTHDLGSCARYGSDAGIETKRGVARANEAIHESTEKRGP